MSEILIGPPRLEGGRLCADITQDGATKTCWFKTSDKYSKYLVAERIDAFLVGLIPLIARSGGKASSRAPVSAYLKHNLEHVLANTLPLFDKSLSPLEISAPIDDTNFHPEHVGTGASCGIDSMATLAEYSTSDTPRALKIDTLAFFDVGSHGDVENASNQEREKRDQLARGRKANVENFAREVALPLMEVESNIYEFGGGFKHINIHTFRSASAVLALGKMFSAYHYASAYLISEFKLSSKALAKADEFLLRCLSTESTRFYSALPSLSRQDRTKIVASFAPAKKYLNVCVTEVDNCGKCFKCVRTMFQLELEGALDEFSQVFDVESYKKRRAKTLHTIGKDVNYHREYLKELKENPGRIPYGKFRFRLALLKGALSRKFVAARKKMFSSGGKA